MLLNEELTLEIDVDLFYEVEPGQKRTYDEPGFDPEVYIVSFDEEKAMQAIKDALNAEKDLLLELAEERKRDSYDESREGMPAWIKG